MKIKIARKSILKIQYTVYIIIHVCKKIAQREIAAILYSEKSNNSHFLTNKLIFQ